MRIIFLEAVQNLGGARKSTIELAKRLQNIGHEVLIVDFWGSCKPFVEMACNANIDLLILDPKEKPIILASSSKIKSLVNKVSYLFYEQQLKKKFQKIIDDFSPDVISLNNCKSLSIVPKSTSFEIHYIARGWFNYNSVPFKDKYILRKYRENIKFFTVSQSTRQAIYSGGLAPLENIYVMTDVIKASIINEKKELNSFTSWDKSNNRPFIIHHCGGFLETKGQLVTLEVAKLLVEKNIDFRLIYTGIIYEGDMSKRYYQKLINDIKISNLEDVVKIVLDPPDIMDYFYKSDVLLLPSYTEGLPRVTLEAMAFGKPVIANPVGGIIDVVINNHTGYVTDFNAVDDYYKSILELLNDKQKYEEISKNCINLIKDNYSEKNQEIAISKYYG
jgi:glycosyltransferase involved in cell wall biosynthesis